jgi:hypothetical protein
MDWPVYARAGQQHTLCTAQWQQFLFKNIFPEKLGNIFYSELGRRNEQLPVTATLDSKHLGKVPLKLLPSSIM